MKKYVKEGEVITEEATIVWNGKRIISPRKATIWQRTGRCMRSRKVTSRDNSYVWCLLANEVPKKIISKALIFIAGYHFVFLICKTFDRFVLGSAEKSFCGL